MTEQGVTAAAGTDEVRLQRRTLLVLSLGAVFGGLGVAGAVTAGGLLVADVSGADWTAGLGQTAMVLGSATFAVPLARRSAAGGRRSGLTLGFVIGAIGAVLVVLAAAADLLPVLLLGLLLFGAAMAAGLQARFAATDLSDDAHVGRHLSLVMWMTAVGAIIGPNLAQPAAATAEALGLPGLSGIFVWSATGFLIATALIYAGLRPDPLLTALQRAHQSPGEAASASRHRQGLRATFAAIRADSTARVAFAAVVAAHAAMVGLMVMTPLHLGDGGASLRIVGIVISVHVMGMYLLAPVVGALADAVGRMQVIALGAGLLVGSGVLAAVVPSGSAALIGIALFLLGLGWSACVVAGSAMLTDALPIQVRPGAQGLTDMAMGVAAATAGALAGVVFGLWSYGALGLLVALALTPLVGIALTSLRAAAQSA
jgi:MFS family permease